ncbi:MAG: glycogen/starch synthase [FCB group bacterium]|nr:glycogen/starch synthase [FCB group bacterium]
MRKKLRILFISPEISPFTPSTPLSELSYHLPRIYRNQGHDIRVLAPKYEFIHDRKYSLREVNRLRDIPLPYDGKLKFASIKSGFIPNTKVQMYFLEQKEYLERNGIYGPINGNELYPDNNERAVVFARSIIEMMRMLAWQPEIIHCVGWFSSLLPFYMRNVYRDDEFYQGSKLVLTVLDPASTGNYDKDILFKAGIDPKLYNPDFDLAFGDGLSFLKGGILYSDNVAVPGKSSLERMAEDFGRWFLEQRNANPDKFAEVGLGIDQHTWNPDKDTKLAEVFSHRNLAGRTANRAKLADKYAFKGLKDGPIVFCVWDGLNLQLLNPLIDKLKSLGGALVLYSNISDESSIDEYVKNHAGYMGRLRVLNSIALRQLLGGGDIIILPPTRDRELMHLNALKYGAIPAAYNSGFFADKLREESDIGFLYDSTDNIMDVMNDIFDKFSDKTGWEKLQKKAMKQDNSWNKVAKCYLDIYNAISGN